MDNIGLMSETIDFIQGSTYYAVDIQKPLWWYVNKWVDANGNDISKPTKGTTAQRPSIVNEGFEYYDTTLVKPIWWTGTKWVNSMGIDADSDSWTTIE